MRIAHVLAAVVALSPASISALTIDDFSVQALVADSATDISVFPPEVLAVSGAGSLTQSLSPLVSRTITLENAGGLLANTIVSFSNQLTFNSGTDGIDALATVTYAFATVLAVTAGTAGFSFGNGSVDGSNVLEASL